MSRRAWKIIYTRLNEVINASYFLSFILVIDGKWNYAVPPNLKSGSHFRAHASKLLVIIWYQLKLHPLTSSFGAGNSIFLSIRPGRNSAESKMSILLVAIITCNSTKLLIIWYTHEFNFSTLLGRIYLWSIVSHYLHYRDNSNCLFFPRFA